MKILHIFLVSFIIITFLMVIPLQVYGISPNASPQFRSMSPIKQIKLGIAPAYVYCKDDLQLVLKTSNLSPACIKADHVARLLANGWDKVDPTVKANHPLVTIQKDKDETAIEIKLRELASTSQSRTNGPNDSLGHPTVTYDEHNLMVTMYGGNSSDGTVIAAKVTDIGGKNVTLSQMLITGSISTSVSSTMTILYADAIGCSVSLVEDQTVTCPYPTAIYAPVTLRPGESLIAYFSGTFKAGTTPITQFATGISYNLETENRPHYTLELGASLFTTAIGK